MSKHCFAPRRILVGILTTFVAMELLTTGVVAQTVGSQPVHFQVNGPSQRLEMIVSTSRILTLEHNVPRYLVNNPEIVRAAPLSPNQIQVSALQTGVTQLNLWDEDQNIYTVDILVTADARELEQLLRAEFPDADIRVRPLASSVLLSGYVPSADMVSRIIRMAQDYYPNVINNLTVGGVQQILLRTKVMEVSRTKLRAFGFDWAAINGNNAIAQSVSGLLGGVSAAAAGNAVSGEASMPPTATGTGGATVRFQIVNGDSAFFGFLEALRQYNLVKVLAEPNLVTVSGRPAVFNSGGEFPIIVPQSLGTVSVEYRQFGTRVDYVPIVLGNGNIRLEVRPSVSEIDPARSVTINNISIPGIRTRWVDTAAELKVGQTMAIAGLLQTRVEAENRGLPWLADLPWVGAAFRRVEEQRNEIELLILVTPEFVDGMDAHEVPPHGPGELTTSPNDIELYWRGYMEVPRCCPDGTCPACRGGAQGDQFPSYEEIMPGGEPADGGATSLEIGFDRAARFPSASGSSRRARITDRPTAGVPSAGGGAATVAGQTDMGSGPAKVHLDDRTGGQPGLIGPVGYDIVK